MSGGYQFFDGFTGLSRFDLTDRLLKFIGIAQIGNSFTGGATSGSLFAPQFSAYPLNPPFAYPLTAYIDPQGNAPVFEPAGDRINWSFPSSVPGSPWTRPDTTLVYGFY